MGRLRRALRWCLGMGPAMLAVALLAAWEAGPSAAKPQVIAVQIKKSGGGERILITHGSSAEKFGAGGFAVSSKVLQIPCPGPYLFESESEDLRTGAVTAYTARLVLSGFSSLPVGVPCGISIPPVEGKASVVLSGSGSANLLFLKGHRRGYGNFVGGLPEPTFPWCGKPYELRSSFSLRNWNQTFIYKARFEQARLLYPGNVSPPPGCG
jgi:hypothetical protein